MPPATLKGGGGERFLNLLQQCFCYSRLVLGQIHLEFAGFAVEGRGQYRALTRIFWNTVGNCSERCGF